MQGRTQNALNRRHRLPELNYYTVYPRKGKKRKPEYLLFGVVNQFGAKYTNLALQFPFKEQRTAQGYSQEASH